MAVPDESDPSSWIFESLQRFDERVADLLTVYCRCLTKLDLPGNAPIDMVLNAICEQTLLNIDIPKKKDAICELEKKRLLLESKLCDLKKERVAADNVMKAATDLKRQFTDKVQFYKHKFDEYKEEIKSLETHLQASGFNSSLTNHALSALKEENRKMSEELAVNSKQLEEYADFEPNNASLSQMVEKLKREVKEYDRYFNRESL